MFVSPNNDAKFLFLNICPIPKGKLGPTQNREVSKELNGYTYSLCLTIFRF